MISSSRHTLGIPASGAQMRVLCRLHLMLDLVRSSRVPPAGSPLKPTKGRSDLAQKLFLWVFAGSRTGVSDP